MKNRFPFCLSHFQVVAIAALWIFVQPVVAGDFHQDLKPLLMKYCAECHSGDDANGDVDFQSITTEEAINNHYELWESVAGHLRNRTMPPEDQPRPSDAEQTRMLGWYQDFVDGIQARPAVMRPRRLSVTEYRNTLRSVLGFDLEVGVIEAEQTVSQRSLVVKLLPEDPPGKSGFKNDTHDNPLTQVVWDQSAYLVDAALEELFSDQRRTELQQLIGRNVSDTGFGNVSSGDVAFNSTMTGEEASRLVKQWMTKAYRRPVSDEAVESVTRRLSPKTGNALVGAVKLELKSILMSPQFFYRGLLARQRDGESPKNGPQPVDDDELAQRLSYFLWADMPDDVLVAAAADGSLSKPAVIAAQVQRMLASPKSRSLVNVFASEWLSLNEIEQVTVNVPQQVALHSQPLDFIHYLFTEDRPLLELLDSKTAFINPYTAKHYGADAKQMPRYRRAQGIEREIVANHQIQLVAAQHRGGILTMPGILAMNRGPILRGTWMLERILGEHIPGPPANIQPVQANQPGENLSFRQRFELHRSNASCAVCHDKIDPLGFALQDYDRDGKWIGKIEQQKPEMIDTSGQLPTGETFNDVAGLKQILLTSQRETVVRNMVQRTMSYALCRKLQVFDLPTVDAITKQMVDNEGTWGDLFIAIAQSRSFGEATFVP